MDIERWKEATVEDIVSDLKEFINNIQNYVPPKDESIGYSVEDYKLLKMMEEKETQEAEFKSNCKKISKNNAYRKHVLRMIGMSSYGYKNM
jgi:cupin superfamily acireductone dioxygenase involved in methionine salvage